MSKEKALESPTDVFIYGAENAEDMEEALVIYSCKDGSMGYLCSTGNVLLQMGLAEFMKIRLTKNLSGGDMGEL